jgi:hypothetical protein
VTWEPGDDSPSFPDLDTRFIGSRPGPFLQGPLELVDRRLEDEAVTAGVKGSLSEVVPPRIDENPEVFRQGAQLMDELQAVDTRQGEIDQDDLEAVLAVSVDRLTRRCDRRHFITQRPQELTEDFADIWIIIDDDDPGWHLTSLARHLTWNKRPASSTDCLPSRGITVILA